MSDSTFNYLMSAFAGLMWWVVLYRPIHTGFLGSTGCLGMSVCAIMAVDDNAFASVSSTESLFLGFCGGVGLVLAHVVLCLRKARNPNPDKAPQRRRGDWKPEAR